MRTEERVVKKIKEESSSPNKCNVILFVSHKKQNPLIILYAVNLSNLGLKNSINVTAVELDSTMVKLATTWFDLQQNDSNKVFVGDGIIFVREAKKREEKYGSIMLDACYNEKHPRICPVEEFTRSNVVQDIADILSGDGVLTVNILCSRDALAIENDLLSVFRKHFENCFLLRYNANQRMLVCTHRKKWSFDEQKGRFMDNCRVVDDRCGDGGVGGGGCGGSGVAGGLDGGGGSSQAALVARIAHPFTALLQS
uniref:Methyltransferase n=1 Tax=Angiostrongylus cantonensis TaxID=6313 RepID=A0A0K0D4L8_ANGCA